MKTTFASRVDPTPFERVKVWDLPTRIFHWALVITVTGAWITTFWEWMLDVHIWFGRLLVLLLGFRMVWGWIGNGFVRFREFVASPQEVLHYLKERAKGPILELGHNPAAGWMMVTLLAVLVALAVTGGMIVSGEERIGVLGGLISREWGINAHILHNILAYGLLVLITGHVLAASLESWAQRQNLPWGMVTGYKRDVPGANLSARSVVPHAWVQNLFLIALGFTGLGAALLLPLEFHDELTQQALTQSPPPGHELYQEECAACHVGFHPSLLPKRSWEALFAGLEDHFGEDASLDEETTQELLAYATAHSAEQHKSEASFRILDSIPANETPFRITETPYWKEKHSEVDPAVFERQSVMSQVNCSACHQYAEYGSFEDAHIKIPE